MKSAQHSERVCRVIASAKQPSRDIDEYSEHLKEKMRGFDSMAYFENEPSVAEELVALAPSGQQIHHYVRSLLTFLDWLPRYNSRWLLGDAIAGFTVALVVVPQAMAYALLASLTPEFGLYTSFAGAATYWLFGTSKDIVIGTTAVGSLLVGQVLDGIEASYPNVYAKVEIVKTLSFVTGIILLAMGMLRLGWIVEVISYIPISAFISAASITIISSQFPTMMGIPDINTRAEPFMVIIDSLRHLDQIKLDAAVGLSCLILLESVKWFCARREIHRPSQKRMWTMISSLRLSFVLLLYTFLSWIVHRNSPDGVTRFKILGKIHPGFVYAGPPKLDIGLVRILLPKSPIVILVLVIEHVAIAKNYGKIYGYHINPSQEIMAQGTANLLGPFLGGYASTGSFGSSAIMSKAGVKTPLAGLFSALILLAALYSLTGAFYYIPRAALAGLIIHAVWNLIATPKTVHKYWRLSPIECLIWIAGVVIAIFVGLEPSIYTTIGFSIFFLVIRVAHTKGHFLGQVSVKQDCFEVGNNSEVSRQVADAHRSGADTRDAYIPLDRKDASNPEVSVRSPHPGVFIYSFPEGLNSLNQALHVRHLTDYILSSTRQTTQREPSRNSDVLWCKSEQPSHSDSSLPVLSAVVLDCSAVNSVDITSIQGLIDARSILDRHASPIHVEWHFGGLWNRWSRRAFAIAGFGFPSEQNIHTRSSRERVCILTSPRMKSDPMPDDSDLENVALLGNLGTEDAVPVRTYGTHGERGDEEWVGNANSRYQEGYDTIVGSSTTLQPLFAIDRPFFHVDLDQAVKAAVCRAKPRQASDFAVGHTE